MKAWPNPTDRASYHPARSPGYGDGLYPVSRL